MDLRRPVVLTLMLLGGAGGAGNSFAQEPLPPISERARKVHNSGMLFDGHNDLPWRLRAAGDMGFDSNDLSKRLGSGQTDIPRLREGGLKAQFWSVYIPSEHENPARTVIEQIDLVHRMVERYPDDFAMAYTADDVEEAVKAGKIASLIGIEGGVAIEDDLAMLRMFARLGARYMTLTHNKTLGWADAATDDPKHDGLNPFGERVVKEMNRLGMLVDISHVSPATMADVLRVSRAPVIASHSSARALAPHPRNVPDEILKEIPKNGGVIMVNFFSGFIVPEAGKQWMERREIRARNPEPAGYRKALAEYNKTHTMPEGPSRTSPTISTTSSRSPGSTTSGSVRTSMASHRSRSGSRMFRPTLGSPKSCSTGATPRPTSTRSSVPTSSGLSGSRARSPPPCRRRPGRRSTR